MRPGQPTLLAQMTTKMTGKDSHMKTFSTISAMLLGLSTLGGASLKTLRGLVPPGPKLMPTKSADLIPGKLLSVWT